MIDSIFFHFKSSIVYFNLTNVQCPICKCTISDKLVVRPVSLYAHLHNSHATMTRQFMQQTSQNACEIKTITYTTLPSNTESVNYPRCLFLFPHSELCSIAKKPYTSVVLYCTSAQKSNCQLFQFQPNSRCN
jgi:hypothetical protein